MRPLRVLVADGQPLVLAGLRLLLEDIDGVSVIGQTTSGREAVEIAKAERPDLVLMEVAMRELNGVDATALIMAELPACRVLMLSAHPPGCGVRAALKAGACGFLLKDAAPAELRNAIEASMAGRVHLSPGLQGALLQDDAPGTLFGTLSPRQREILQLLAEGRSTRQISCSLHVSVKTIESHRANLMEKLGIPHLAGLVLYALRENLVSVQ